MKMKPMNLTEVRKHTGRRLSYAEAVKLANPGDPFLRNMAIALSLHSWNNTSQDWLMPRGGSGDPSSQRMDDTPERSASNTAE